MKLKLKIITISLVSLLFYNSFFGYDNMSEFFLILKPSSINDLGVFAVKDIPAGTLLYDKEINLRVLKVKDIPKEFIQYCIVVNQENCLCPENFDRMEIVWYLNNSSNPNITPKGKINQIISKINNKSDDLPDSDYYELEHLQIFASRDIKAGEELLFDQNYIDEPKNIK